MGLVQNIKKRLQDANRREKAVAITQELANHLHINPLCTDYENVFAQVQPIVNEMKVVVPYGVGKNGGALPITRTPELAVLFAPNEKQGFSDFAQTMFTSWLTEDELNIHVHMEKGKVIGYTVLPSGCKVRMGNGRYRFQVNTTEGLKTLEKDEVMTLMYSRSPDDIERGVSPASAVRAWAQTEDVLAQYQRSYIENGAIPASITFIRASTHDKFEQTRQELESNLRGARNHGKTIYVWRQFNNDTGESLDQVEVKTIQGNNSTLAIKELSDIINDHLNKAFGVSNFILGDDSSAKYDNAELSQRQFMQQRVYPALDLFWGSFQHELDRIVGGLGYSIQFDLELPELTEKKRADAEIASINAETLTQLVQAGAPPLSAVRALGLSDEWQNVAVGIKNSVLVASKTSGTGSQTSLENKNLAKSRFINLHSDSATSTDAIKKSDELPPMDREERKIYRILLDMAVRIFSNEPNIDEDEVIAEIVEILEGKAQLGGVDGAKHLIEILKDEAIVAELKNELKNLSLSGTLRERIHDRTEELVKGYGEATRDILENTLEASQGMGAGEITQALKDAMPRYNAERIARTEAVYAFKSGRLDEDQKIAAKYHLKMKLQWKSRHDGAVCPVCAAMDGEIVTVGEAFEHFKETADGAISWEPSMWNDHGRIPAPHPNCRCYFNEIVEEE